MEKTDRERALWEKCAAFHGHECPGLTIGYRASLYAIELLGLTFSEDEQTACISENDACGVDAVQVILGCTAGKGNLLFHLTGKQAFSFYERKSGRSVRLVLKSRPKGLSRQETFELYHSLEAKEMFDVKETRLTLPEKARLFESVECECCGETAADHFIRLEGGKKLCLDCWDGYSRFSV